MKIIKSDEKQENQIIIENLQDIRPLDDELIKLLDLTINECLRLSKIDSGCEISLAIVDNVKIRELNRQFRNIDTATDVLSFPMLDMIEGKIVSTEGDYDLDEELLLLGDIVISLEKAYEQAAEYGHTLTREIAFLATHGVFHLLGYDHQNDEQASKMIGKQEEVLANLGLVRE